MLEKYLNLLHAEFYVCEEIQSISAQLSSIKEIWVAEQLMYAFRP